MTGEGGGGLWYKEMSVKSNDGGEGWGYGTELSVKVTNEGGGGGCQECPVKSNDGGRGVMYKECQ